MFTTSAGRLSRPWSARPIAVLPIAALAGVLFFAGIGAYPFVDGDAAFYGRVARNAAEHGQWLPLRFELTGGGYPVDNPPLAIWLTAVSFALFGVSEAAARAPHAALAVLMVVVATAFARRKLGPLPGLAAGLVLATAGQMFYMAREPMVDVPVSLCILLTVDFADRFAATRRARFFCLACAFMAAGVLCKGPVALAVPLVLLAADSLLGRLGVHHYLPTSRGQLAAGVALFALIVVPWHVAMFATEGTTFAKMYVEAVTGQGWIKQAANPGLALVGYPSLLLLGFLPWTGALLAALVRAAREWRTDGVVRLAVAWIAADVLVFAVAPSHVVIRYMLPAFPAGSVLIARLLTGSDAKPTRVAGVLTIVLGLGLGGFAIVAGRSDAPPAVAAAARTLAARLAVVAVCAGAFWIARRPKPGMLALAAGTLAAYLALVGSAPAIVPELYAHRDVAAVVNSLAAPGARAATFRAGTGDLTMISFYLAPAVEDCASGGQLASFLEGAGERWVLELPSRPLTIRSAQLELVSRQRNGIVIWRKRAR